MRKVGLLSRSLGLLATNVGALLGYRSAHEQNKKYQHHADRSR